MLIVTTPDRYIKADDGTIISLDENNNISIEYVGNTHITILNRVNGKLEGQIPPLYKEEVLLFNELINYHEEKGDL